LDKQFTNAQAEFKVEHEPNTEERHPRKHTTEKLCAGQRLYCEHENVNEYSVDNNSGNATPEQVRLRDSDFELGLWYGRRGAVKRG